MLKGRRFSLLIGFVAMALSSITIAQNYPNKVIRIITGGAGASTDIAARLVAQGISGPLGQQVIVENRPAMISIDVTAKAPPDGYTLLVSGGTLWTLPLMEPSDYDPIKDFSPISMLAAVPQVLVVNPSIPVNNVKELIVYLKSKPGQLNYSTAGTGATPHIAAELFKSMAGVNIVRVPYKSIGEAVAEVVSGRIQVMFPTAGGMESYIDFGRLKALAVTSLQPSVLFPNLPTMEKAAGLPGFEVISVSALFAPAKTPDAVTNRLNQEIVKLLAQDDVKARFIKTGVVATSSTREELASRIKSEMSRMEKLVKENNMAVQ